jgi:broad specificity phosphatase PhoE
VGKIILIRHGQASAHAQDYDQLSELGFQQCSFLKNYLNEQQIKPTKVFFGPRKRHQQTAQAIQNKYWPEAILLPELDEYPAHELIEFGLDQLLTFEPTLETYVNSVRSSSNSAGDEFVVLLQYSARYWMNGKITSEHIESYKEYKRRMETITNLMQKATKDDCIVLISSGGFISTLLSHIVDGSAEKSLNTSWALHNASINVVVAREFLCTAAVNNIQFLPKNMRTFI